MAKIGNEAKLILKLANERINKANADDDRKFTDNHDARLVSRIEGRNDALATLKSIYLELET